MMHINNLTTAGAILLLAISITGCSPEDGNQQAAKAGVSDPAATVAEVKRHDQEAIPELTGTAWQLVNIVGMDDSKYEPDDGSLYTLEFNADGNTAIRADCNRGKGSWSSESPGQLQFGPIATTRAMCAPESLSDKFLAQFEWVRSYVLQDGHLYLATMADGAIIDFEPLLRGDGA